MFKLNIDNVEYGFPERLSVTQWKGIMQWDLAHTSTWPKVISTLMGIHPKDLKDISDAQLELCMGVVYAKVSERKEIQWKDPNTLTFGEWVDLDVWIGKGSKNNIDDILRILGVTPHADEAMYILDAYINWRNFMYRQYSELFGIEVDEDDEIIVDEDRTPNPDAIANGWYTIIINLAGDNILNIDKITEQPIIPTLNFMAHQKAKVVAENFRQLKQQREYELQRRR